MSDIVPRTQVQKIEYYELHAPIWLANALALGTTVPIATDLQTKTDAARAAYTDQQEAYSLARAKTEILDNAIEAMGTVGAAVMKQIRGQAEISGPSIYTLAQIPAPATPTPMPPPGKPSDLLVTLDETGILNLKWKCPNPHGSSGTIYQIYRRIGLAGEFEYLGGAGGKLFVDNTLPAGSASVTYQIQAVRSTAVGPWAQFNVNFGLSSGGAGGVTVSVSEGTPAKIAA
jgi:hypothetical protein